MKLVQIDSESKGEQRGTISAYFQSSNSLQNCCYQ